MNRMDRRLFLSFIGKSVFGLTAISLLPRLENAQSVAVYASALQPRRAFECTVCVDDVNTSSVSQVTDASIYVDGVYSGRTDANGSLLLPRVSEGFHTLGAERDGYDTHETMVNVAGYGSVLDTHLALGQSVNATLEAKGDQAVALQNTDGGWAVHIPDASYYDGTGGNDFMAISSATIGLLFLWYSAGKDEFLDAARKALDLIVAEQNPDGGWGIPYEWTHWDHDHPKGASYTVVTAETAMALLTAKDLLGTTDYDEALINTLGYFDTNFASQIGDTWTYCPIELYAPWKQTAPDGEQYMQIHVYNIDAEACGALSHPFMINNAPHNKDRIDLAISNILSTQQPESPYGFPYSEDSPSLDDPSVYRGYTRTTLYGLLLKNKQSPDLRITECATKILSTDFASAGSYGGAYTPLNADSDMVGLLPFDTWVNDDEGRTCYKDTEAARDALYTTMVLPIQDDQGRITRDGLSSLRPGTGYLAVKYLGSRL